VDSLTNIFYNSFALIGPEGFIGKYRKIHPYVSDLKWAKDGDLGLPVWKTDIGNIAGIVCMDAIFPESSKG